MRESKNSSGLLRQITWYVFEQFMVAVTWEDDDIETYREFQLILEVALLALLILTFLRLHWGRLIGKFDNAIHHP